MAGDADDLYFDPKQKGYMSAEDLVPSVYSRKMMDNNFNHIANIPTRSGARTSLYIPQLNLFVVAERAVSGKPADILIYKIKN